MRIPEGYKLRLRSTEDAQKFSEALTVNIAHWLNGREITLLQDVEIQPAIKPKSQREQTA